MGVGEFSLLILNTMENTSSHRKILALGGVSLLLGLAYMVLFYLQLQQIGLNYPLAIILLVVCGLGLARLFARPIERSLYVFMGFAVFFSVMVFVRESPLLSFFNIIGSALLLLMVMSALVGKKISTFLAWDYVKVVFLPLRFIIPFFETLAEIASLRKVVGEHSISKEVIRGSLMAVIAIGVFSALFASADPVFNQILSHVFNFEVNADLMRRFVFTAFVTAFFIGAFGYLFRKVHAPFAPPVSVTRSLGAIEIMILFGAINVLFFVFIVLQLTHLFGGVSNLVEQGLTYAEYARKGFFELVVVAVLSYLIISVAEKQIVKEGESHLRSFKILSGALVLEVVLILVSAFMRLSLYEDAYGFSIIRLYSHALMIWIGVVLVLLSRHIWTNSGREVFAFRAFCSVILLLFTMNIINPDAFIAKKNLERYDKSGQIDAVYLGELSSDALPYTIRLLDDPNQQVRNDFDRSLNVSKLRKSDSWQSKHLSRAKAEKMLENKTPNPITP